MDRPRLLFTAFEPSGDALAAAVIGHLKQRRPNLGIHALGGPRMQDQGAELIELTTDHAAMFLGAVSQVRAHYQRLARLKTWLNANPINVLIPVDSPAANWSVCRLVRRLLPEAKIAHLAAPQLWAWAPWRIRKLRRLTDHVLCLLPFEPAWFTPRGVPTSFVGHPIFDPPPQATTGSQTASAPSPQPSMTLAVLPGSRLSEIHANGPAMLQTVAGLRKKHRELHICVAAVDDQAAATVRQIAERELGGQGWAQWLTIEVDDAPGVLAKSDLALVVSGTATLLVAAHRKPMVVVYHVNPWTWRLAGRWLMRTPYFALPNLITDADGLGQAVPEFVPHFGQIEPLVEALDQLICRPELRQRQAEAFDHIASRFEGHSFRELTARHVMRCLEQIEFNR